MKCLALLQGKIMIMRILEQPVFFFQHFKTRFLAGFFNVSALDGMAGVGVAYTIRFWLKFFFLTITQMFLNVIVRFLKH